MARSWEIGLGAIVARQQELAATALIDMTELMATFRPTGYPEDALGRQTKFATKVMDTAIANAHDIVDLTGRSGSQAFNIAQQYVVATAGDWLSDPAHRVNLADFVLGQLPSILAVVDRSGLPSFIGEHVRTELEHVEVTPLAAGLLGAAVAEGRHQRVLDALLDGLDKLVNERSAIEALRQRIRAQLPAVFNLYTGEPVVMNKIIDSINTLIVEVRTDPTHSVRVELDGYLTAFIERLRSSPELAGRLEGFKFELLARPELTDLAANLWNALRDVLMRDAASGDSQLRRQLEAIQGPSARKFPQDVNPFDSPRHPRDQGEHLGKMQRRTA